MEQFVIPSLIIIALILLNGLFVAAEFCIISVPPTRITQLVEEGHLKAQAVKAILDDPIQRDHYIATAQIGITVASLGLGMYGEQTIATWLIGPFEHWLHLEVVLAHTLALVLAISLLTFAHVVLGEMVPKSLALQFAEKTVLAISAWITFAKKLFYPLVILLNSIGNGVLWLLKVPPVSPHRRLYSSEELEIVIKESHKGGLLDDNEQRILENIFAFRERRVGQVMTPRPRISALALTCTLAELRRHLKNFHYSRFPVYEKDLDQIVGMLLVKDFVDQQIHKPGKFNLKGLIRYIPKVPETMAVARLLAIFKRSHTHMALVFDEYGSTAGIVTLEDIVEEVVGELHDEFDLPEPPPLFEIEPGILLARGDLLLDNLRVAIPDLFLKDEHLPDVETIGGLLVGLLDRPPEPGDLIEMEEANFTVESVSGLAVKSVRVERKVHNPPSEESDQTEEKIEVKEEAESS